MLKKSQQINRVKREKLNKNDDSSKCMYSSVKVTIHASKYIQIRNYAIEGFQSATISDKFILGEKLLKLRTVVYSILSMVIEDNGDQIW